MMYYEDYLNRTYGELVQENIELKAQLYDINRIVGAAQPTIPTESPKPIFNMPKVVETKKRGKKKTNRRSAR